MEASEVVAQIIDIARREVRSAANVLTSAFSGDAVFEYCFGDPERYQRSAPSMFAGYASWARLYGRAWATRDGKGVALRLPPNGPGFGRWNTFRAGMIWPFMRLESSAQLRFGQLAELVTQTRHRVMGKTPHWYCWMIGVMPNEQGKGLGGKLMRHTFNHAARDRAPCYLETFSDENVKVHSSQGYEVREVVSFEGTHLKLFAMVRPVVGNP